MAVKNLFKQILHTYIHLIFHNMLLKKIFVYPNFIIDIVNFLTQFRNIFIMNI